MNKSMNKKMHVHGFMHRKKAKCDFAMNMNECSI